MSAEHTQQQSPDDERRAKDLSLKHTRPPAELPGYEAERLLGRGAYGEVWVALDRNTGRRVAIKFYLHRTGVDWTQISREVEKLVYLSADRYVVQLLEVGWSADPPYYVMEYIENGSLDDYLRLHRRLPVVEATAIFRELTIGLNHAHGKGVLHCDLKPANVLLDQDHRPRLADFGQSRLSHEQKPALGTLFYMAPEQADLNAVPDAKWDVYALGAIFYRMLTGEPPLRTAAAASEIENSSKLPERLARYRQHLAESPPPTEHRRVQGIDRALIEIIDRCLVIDLERRFANVQEILDALTAREQARARRPLMLLGFVGPILLLLIMAMTGLRGYEHAVKDSERAISRRARESNFFAAMLAASSIEGEMSRYFRMAQLEADKAEFRQAFDQAAGLPLVQQLNDPQLPPSDFDRVRAMFIEDPIRKQLNDYLARRMREYLDRLKVDHRELKLASILVVDAKGRMLAASYDTEVETRSVGKNYAFRSYFHGGSGDLDIPHNTTPVGVQPITEPHLSAAFQSSTTGTWKVAISTPILSLSNPGESIGVLALTVNLGDFAYFRNNSDPDRFAALIDGREGSNFGVILQHPLLDRLNAEGSQSVDHFRATKYRITPEQLHSLRTNDDYRYRDPFASAPGGEAYRCDWIAGVERVRLTDGSSNQEDMIVLIQERYTEATEPVKQLGRRLKGEGLWSLGGISAVIFVLWYIVLRVLQESRQMQRPLVAHTYAPSPPASTIADTARGERVV